MASGSRCRILLAARGGVERDDLLDLLRAEASRLAGEGRRLAGFLRLAEDPFAGGGPPLRGFDGTLELRWSEAQPAAAFAEAVAGLGERAAPLVHVDLSAVLVGEDHVFTGEPETPVLFQYFMRRRRDLDHAQYCEHYRERHSRFGIATPEVASYVQFHVDPAASHTAAGAAGLGLWSADSISQLHLADLRRFLSAVAHWELRDDAAEDEERFIDRRNSVMWTSERILL